MSGKLDLREMESWSKWGKKQMPLESCVTRRITIQESVPKKNCRFKKDRRGWPNEPRNVYSDCRDSFRGQGGPISILVTFIIYYNKIVVPLNFWIFVLLTCAWYLKGQFRNEMERFHWLTISLDLVWFCLINFRPFRPYKLLNKYVVSLEIS